MNYQVDDSIREDYLNEAGEIVNQLGEQLVRLERQPDDRELLDSIFRAFHTIKGGAGFLDIAPLVDCCHCAEEVFDALRRKEGELDADIMDAILHALDVVTAMLEALRAGSEPQPAPPALLDQLRGFVRQTGGAGPKQAPAQSAGTEGGGGDVTDDEFENMLAEALEGDSGTGESSELDVAGKNEESDEITEDEFEALLDQMQGQGEEVSATESDARVEDKAAAPEMSRTESDSEDEITEAEFEALLDELQQAGSGQQETPAPDPVQPEQNNEAQKAAPRVQTPTTVAESTVRVDVSRLDTVMNLVGELVLVRNRLTNLGAQLKNEELQNAVGNLDLVTADLQMGVMQTRMQPIGKVFSRFPRLTRDLARNLNKEIELTMQGEDTDLDKNLVEALADPLVHLVRNAMDHGIESPGEREAKGKPRAGHVELAAAQEGDHIVITIRDDGAGIDADALRRKAVAKGLVSNEVAAKLERHECFDLMLLPGLSSRDEVSEVSGRGVGMDVVKTRIGELNGTIDIQSEPDQGTTFRVRVPLTLAILPALMVQLGRRRYAFPLSHVVEVFFLEPDAVRQVEGRDVVMVRDKPLPLVFLDRLMQLGDEGQDDNSGYVVVIQVGSDAVGFVTDDVLGQEEVVIKPLGTLLQGLTGFAGATITGDGYIALIMDVNGLMKRVGRLR
ncbi:chemotaxis protein CheA [Wenzhouxiangella sp. AB-CW3]|uniref:chemotaxis protein CheA n=1 Tax=Wenzhouxiangella sp. AB-CW3 TaxID=2771012 RepID=UPI00168AE2B8|nr:chemotaxis protein CheA [Wenzhouxiangella sp. AB-CW3]QOC21185.1 chemotaxis protein CheA [Wenzhouxiangella sp. AB-CW3]